MDGITDSDGHKSEQTRGDSEGQGSLACGSPSGHKGLDKTNYKTLIKMLMLGKIEGKRRRGQQRVRWLDSITNSVDTSKLRETDGQGNQAMLHP